VAGDRRGAAVDLQQFQHADPTERMVYSEFIQEIQRDQVRKVTIDGLTIYGERFDGSRFETTRPMVEDPKLIDDLLSTASRSRVASPSSRACGRSCWWPVSRS
jgi:ATP-dependent Zn protease